MSDLVETTSWLIGIPSETGAERPLRDAIAARLAAFPQTLVADSLVVGTPGESFVLLAGHLDTVPLQGDLGPRLAGDRLYGLGATDMKAGLAVMIHLVEALGRDHLVAVFYAGEEGSLSGNQLCEVLRAVPWLSRAEAAVVLEPTDGEIQAGCNGSINARVFFEGVAAHSARPWLGENAVTKAGAFLAGLHGRTAEVHLIEGLTFKEVISVTMAEGGVARNIIPSHFEVNVNYRFAPDRSLEEAIELLRLVCAEADGIEIDDAAPAGSVDIDHPLFAALIESTGARLAGKQGWTDVAQLTQAGIPALNFGPGETALAHKPGESVQTAHIGWVYESLLSVLR